MLCNGFSWITEREALEGSHHFLPPFTIHSPFFILFSVVTMEKCSRHYLWITEYVWRMKGMRFGWATDVNNANATGVETTSATAGDNAQTPLEASDKGRTFTILDMEGVSMSDFGGPVVNFVKLVSGLISTHYPERSSVIFIINASWTFNFIWKACKTFIAKETVAKTRVFKAGADFTSELFKFCDAGKWHCFQFIMLFYHFVSNAPDSLFSL
jgi:hypothetical protein